MYAFMDGLFLQLEDRDDLSDSYLEKATAFLDQRHEHDFEELIDLKSRGRGMDDYGFQILGQHDKENLRMVLNNLHERGRERRIADTKRIAESFSSFCPLRRQLMGDLKHFCLMMPDHKQELSAPQSCSQGPSAGGKHSTAQHSTAQHSTAQHSTAQHGAAQHSTAQHSTAHLTKPHHIKLNHSTAQHSTAQHGTAQHGTARHSTAHDITAQLSTSSLSSP